MFEEYNPILAEYLSLCVAGDPRAAIPKEMASGLYDTIGDILRDHENDRLASLASDLVIEGWIEKRNGNECVHHLLAATLIYAIRNHETEAARNHPLHAQAYASIMLIEQLMQDPS
jgi:hypothetical protein